MGDYADVISGVDYLIAQGYVDKDRVGSMGWSEGGYISAFITTSSDRFKAVLSEITNSARQALADFVADHCYVVAIVGIASLTYRFIELPGQRYFSRLARGNASIRFVASSKISLP